MISDHAVHVLADTPPHGTFGIHRPHEHLLPRLLCVFEKSTSQRPHQDLLVNIVRDEIGEREEPARGMEIEADKGHGEVGEMCNDLRDEGRCPAAQDESGVPGLMGCMGNGGDGFGNLGDNGYWVIVELARLLVWIHITPCTWR